MGASQSTVDRRTKYYRIKPVYLSFGRDHKIYYASGSTIEYDYFIVQHIESSADLTIRQLCNCSDAPESASYTRNFDTIEVLNENPTSEMLEITPDTKLGYLAELFPGQRIQLNVKYITDYRDPETVTE